MRTGACGTDGCNKSSILSIAHLANDMAKASHSLTYLFIPDTSSIILQIMLRC